MVDGEFDNLTVNNVLAIGGDTNLYRSAADTLKTDDKLVVGDAFYGTQLFLSRGTSTYPTINSYVAGDTKNRFTLYADGSIKFGDGTNFPDVTLYRSAANVLKTPDNFDTLALRIDGTEVLTSARVLKNIGAIEVTMSAEGESIIATSSGRPWFTFERGGVNEFNWTMDANGNMSLVEDKTLGNEVITFLTSGRKVRIHNSLIIGSDVELYRSAANTLGLNGALSVNDAPAANSDASLYMKSKDASTTYTTHLYNYRDGNFVIDISGNCIVDLSDAAGSSKFSIRDSGYSEVASINSDGQLQLPTSGSSGGLVTGSGVSIEHDAEIIDINDLRLPTEDLQDKAYTTLGHGNILFKNTLPESQGVREYPDGEYTSLFLVMVENPPPYEGKYCPMLATDHGLWVEKDIQTYGALFTSSDPGKSSGGGAIMMGHGFNGATAEPQFILTDTIGGGAGATATLTISGGVITNVTVTDGGSGYTFADVTVNTTGGSGARLAPVIEDGEIQDITVYDGGSGYSGSDTVSITNNPHNILYLLQRTAVSPYTSRAHLALGDLQAYGAIFTLSDPETGYGGGAILIGHGFTGSTDPPKIYLTDSSSGYDKLYLKKVDGSTPAHLDLGNLTVHGGIVVGDYGISSAGDAIFNSVLCTASGAFKVGTSGGTTYVSLTRSGSTGYINAHYGNLHVCSLYDIYLEPVGEQVRCEGDILPVGAGEWDIGTSTADWNYVYANYLRYDVDCDDYDALDDLGLAKNYKTKTVTKNGVETTVIDMKESFPFLIEEEHIAHEKLQGYMLGCVKALVMRVEALENQLKQNQTPD